MKRFTGVKGTLILVVLVFAMVAYYGYLSNKASRKAEEDAALTKVQSVLMRDLELNYPPSPREVVKYFGDITLCLYDGASKESDIDKLAAKALQLYDNELAANNPWADYLLKLKNEVADYEEKGMAITSYAPAGSTSVDFFDKDGYEWARVYCTFYVKENKKDSWAVNEIFLLRKDEEGHWKIYGWDLAENVDISKAEDAEGE